MLAVAHRAGIKGPSLYKHFATADALLIALEHRNLEELRLRLEGAKGSLSAMVNEFCAFALERPEQFSLLLRSGDPEKSFDAMRPPMALLTKILSDPEEALVRLRILTSFLYGFILMSRAGAFRQEGDLSVVTKRALELIVPEGNEL